MPISIEPTPNPNAMKFTVDRPVGGPVTYTDAESAEPEVVRRIFAAGDVRQVFMTANFISVTKQPDAEWDDILPPVREAIEAAYA